MLLLEVCIAAGAHVLVEELLPLRSSSSTATADSSSSFVAEVESDIFSVKEATSQTPLIAASRGQRMLCCLCSDN